MQPSYALRFLAEVPSAHFVVHELRLDELLLFRWLALQWLHFLHHLLLSIRFLPVYIAKPCMIFYFVRAFYT